MFHFGIYRHSTPNPAGGSTPPRPQPAKHLHSWLATPLTSLISTEPGGCGPRAHRQAASSRDWCSFCGPPECNGGPAGGTRCWKVVGFYNRVDHTTLVGQYSIPVMRGCQGYEDVKRTFRVTPRFFAAHFYHVCMARCVLEEVSKTVVFTRGLNEWRALCQIMYSLLVCSDGMTSVVPSEQTPSSYIILYVVHEKSIWTNLNAWKPNVVKSPGKVRARTYGTKSPSRSEALRFIDSAKSPSTKIDGSLVNFRRRLSNRHGRPRKMLIMDIRRTPIGKNVFPIFSMEKESVRRAFLCL